MSKPRSFRRRIVVAFLGSGMVLAVAFAVTVGSTVMTTEDEIQRRQLLGELEFLLQRGELSYEKVIHLSRYMTAYVGLDSVPADLRSRLAPLGEGAHEIHERRPRTAAEDLELQVAVAPLPDHPERLYLVFNVSAIEAEDRPPENLIHALVVGLAVVMGLVVLLGSALTSAVVRPLSDLARLVRSTKADELPERIHPEKYDEEVGVLARALRDATVRVRGFIQREREFTGNASHELRTPLTVIKGAAELIEAQPAARQEAVRKPLDRIHRAVGDMEETIGIFLELAREDSLDSAVELCPLRQVVEDVIEHHRRLLADRPVDVEIRVPGDVKIEASERALSIVLGNLIGNAFARTEKGAVSIEWRESGVDITNTGPGIPGQDLDRVTDRHFAGENGGYGLGLSIVQTLCKRYGWGLEIDRAGAGTTVRVSFNSSA
jgi:signal transduction histidine kinase